MTLFARKSENEQKSEKEKSERELVAFVEKEAEKRKRARLPFELQWRLNTNFLLGNQHCDVNVRRLTVENYRPVYDYMSSEVFNRIAPIMETRRAQLLSVNYDLAVLPCGENYADARKAETASALISGVQGTEEYRAAFNKAVALFEQTGSAFFLSWWEEDKKRIATTVLSPYEVLPEDLYADNMEDQRSVIIEQVKRAKEVSELYGVQVEGGKAESFGITRTCGAGGFGYEGSTAAFVPVGREDVVFLRSYMEKPSKAHPHGRLIITAGGKLLCKGDLPLDRYPLCEIKSGSLSGQFFGKSIIETLIPLQRSYNGIKNCLNDFINRSTCGQLLIEDGSVDAEDLTDRGLVPGEPIVYRRGSVLPKLLEEPAISGMAPEQCSQLSNDMEYAAGVSVLMADGAIAGGNSYKAIELLRNIDTVRLSLVAESIRAGVRELGRIWLELFRAHVKKGSVLNVCDGSRAGRTVELGEDELNSDILVFPLENSLREKEETARERYEKALSLGLFSEKDGSLSPETKKKALRRLLSPSDVPDSEEEAQQHNAASENKAFCKGEPLAVLPLDDHRLHLAEHRLFALGKRFRSLLLCDREKAQPMLDHIEEHRKLLEKQEHPETPAIPENTM